MTWFCFGSPCPSITDGASQRIRRMYYSTPQLAVWHSEMVMCFKCVLNDVTCRVSFSVVSQTQWTWPASKLVIFYSNFNLMERPAYPEGTKSTLTARWTASGHCQSFVHACHVFIQRPRCHFDENNNCFILVSRRTFMCRLEFSSSHPRESCSARLLLQTHRMLHATCYVWLKLALTFSYKGWMMVSCSKLLWCDPAFVKASFIAIPLRLHVPVGPKRTENCLPGLMHLINVFVAPSKE